MILQALWVCISLLWYWMFWFRLYLAPLWVGKGQRTTWEFPWSFRLFLSPVASTVFSYWLSWSFKECSLEPIFVVDGPASYVLRSECLHVFKCTLSGRLLENHNFYVTLGDDVLVCVCCKQIFEEFSVWPQFAFLTYAARTAHKVTCLEGDSGGVSFGKVEYPHLCTFMNPSCSAGDWNAERTPRILIGSEPLNICEFYCTSSSHAILSTRLATSLS